MHPPPQSSSTSAGDLETTSVIVSTLDAQVPRDAPVRETVSQQTLDTKAKTESDAHRASSSPRDVENGYTHHLVVTDPDGITVGLFRKNMQLQVRSGQDAITRPRTASQSHKRSLNEIPRQPPTPQQPLPPTPIRKSVELERAERFATRVITPDRIIVPPPPDPVFFRTGLAEEASVLLDVRQHTAEQTTGWLAGYPGERPRSVTAPSRGDLGETSFTPFQPMGEKAWWEDCCMQ